jgi:hypothetical protein
MAQTNREVFVDRLAGTTANDIGGKATVDGMFTVGHVERITNTAANGAIAVTKFWSNPHPFPVVATFYLNCDAAVAFNATNYASHLITIDDGANGSPVAAATFTTSTVNYAADTDATATTTNTAICVVAAGANVFYEVTQTAAGVALPVRMLKMRARRK